MISNILQFIFWVLMIVVGVLLLIMTVDYLILSKAFKKRISKRLEKIENKVYKEEI